MATPDTKSEFAGQFDGFGSSVRPCRMMFGKAARAVRSLSPELDGAMGNSGLQG
jgi:hypothetical protein